MLLVILPLIALFFIWILKVVTDHQKKTFNMDYKVKQFTEESGYDIPKKPIKMSLEQGKFISQMIISEVVELLQTFYISDDEINQVVIEAVEKDRRAANNMPTDSHIMAEQIDAFVDIVYYILNCTNKHGYDFMDYFNEVHDANMRKKINGQFIKRDDGKIIKPEGWREPDILTIVRRALFTENDSY